MGFLARIVPGGATTLTGAPIWLWIIVGLLLANVAQEGLRRVQVGELRVHLADEKRGRAEDRRITAEAAAKKEHENGIETLKRLERQARNDEAKEAALRQARRDRDRAVAAGDALQLRLDAYLRATVGDGRPGDSAAEDQCAPARAAARVLADLFRRADQRAGVLAEAADAARIAGQQCAADYDALTLKATPP